jgi:hypothetical protein
MVSITAASAVVAPPARRFDHGPDLLTLHRDMAAPFGLTVDEDLLRAGRNVSHRDLLDELIEAQDVRGASPDLIIVAHALPDMHPLFVGASYVNKLLGGKALSFAIIEQGLAAPFTALRIAAAFHASGRSSLSMIAVLEQTTLPTRLPLVHDNEVVDSGAVLLLGHGQGMRVAGVRTVMPGESVRDRIVALVGGQPGQTLVVAGSRVDADAIPDGLPVRWCDPATYCTSVWVELAEHRDTWRAEYSTVVLCDSEPRSGRTYLALLAGSTFSAVPEGVWHAGFRRDS